MTEGKDKVIVSDFLSIAGGAVRGNTPGDVDVVVRAEFIGDKLTVSADSVLLQVRNYIAERLEIDRHDLPIHIIPEPTGPHSDYIPLADLVLRFKPDAVVEVKSNQAANFIHFVGTGPSEPVHDGETRWNTATLVNISGVNLLVDAPSGIAERLDQSPDAVLVSHRHRDACSGLSELHTTVYAPEQIGEHDVVLVTPGTPFRVKDVTVTPFRVIHGDVTTVGYRMEADSIAVAVAHDIAEIPEESLKFFDGAIAVVDAAGWDHPVFDHWAVAEHLTELRDAGALHVYLTQVGRSVPEEPELPAWAELAHDGMVVPLENAEKALWPMKPAVPFYFENFSAAQMWEGWGHSHAPFAVEPKWNGWRFRIAIGDDGVKATTESGKDVSSYLVDVVKQLRLPGGPVELDGELLMVANGRIVPRHLMPAVLSTRRVEWTAHPRFFDILSGGGVSKDTPYRERRKVLERIVPEEFLTPMTIVGNKQELESAFERFGFIPGSEGIVAKDLDSVITGGPSQSWSKVKRMLEVRARVVSAERKENGWSYDCEWADGHPTGKTMVTRIQAKPGDVVTVLCQELVPSGDTLKFQNAVVTDVNEGRPLTLQEAMRVMLEHANAELPRKMFAGGPMPFRGLGTKARLAGKILELFTDHEIYCEPFVGSLGFFARKPKVKGVQEIISDLDEVKYRCYRFLQRASEAQIAEVIDEIANVRPDREIQEEVQHGKPRSDREAFRLTLLGNFFMRGREIPYPPFVSFKPNPGTYIALKHRLAGVKILHKDALDVIRSLRNNPNVLFYLDPPYATADHAVYYREQFDKQKFMELLELLKTIKGRFILSCYRRDLAGFKIPASWHVHRVRVYTITPHGGGHATDELLITNYKPEKGKWLKSVRDRIIELPKVSEVGKALAEEQAGMATNVNEGGPFTLHEAVSMRLEHANAELARKWFAGGPMPFQGLGTKTRLARKILELFPDHSLYCEPFVGTLNFFAIKPKIGEEVIADIDGTKIAAYRFIQRASDSEIAAVVEEARRTPLTRETQRRLKEAKPRSGREAALFLMIGSRFYLGYESVNWPPSHRHRLPVGTFLALKRRFRGVRILHADAFDLIRKFRNRKDVLFYLDPPYPTSDARSKYRYPFTIEQFAELLRLLKTIRGKFILSCKPNDLKASGVTLPETWHVFRVVAYRMANSGHGLTPNQEVLITNFVPEKGKWMNEVSSKAEPIPHYRELEANVKELAEETDDTLPGDTRSERAERTWEEKWHEFYPADGHGRFIVQRHIRGLTREEVSNPPAGHSVHYDLRMTAHDGSYLFGFTIFSEKGVENAWEALKDGKIMRCTPKQPQPLDWLEVGKGEPFVSGPGEVGSTTQKYARFDAVDWGTYDAGTWNRHFVEVVLRGRKGKSVLLTFQRIQPGVWTVKAGGEPIARHETIEQIRARLAQRGHEVFFYRDPLSDKPPVRVSIKGWLGKTVRQLPHLPWRLFLAMLPRLRSGAICYKIVGDLIILPVTNRFLDLQGDFVTKQAVQSLLENPPRNATVRIAHKDGTDIADLIAFIPYKRFVFGIGKFRHTPKARFFKSFLTRYPTGHPTIAPYGWATSVGFWGVRDPNDPSQIIELRLREVSILPAGAAANPWTTFPIDQKEEE